MEDYNEAMETVETDVDTITNEDDLSTTTQEQDDIPMGAIAIVAGAVVTITGAVVFVAKNHKRIGRAVRSGFAAAKWAFRDDVDGEVTDVKVEFVTDDESQESKK